MTKNLAFCFTQRVFLLEKIYLFEDKKISKFFSLLCNFSFKKHYFWSQQPQTKNQKSEKFQSLPKCSLVLSVHFFNIIRIIIFGRYSDSNHFSNLVLASESKLPEETFWWLLHIEILHLEVVWRKSEKIILA